MVQFFPITKKILLCKMLIWKFLAAFWDVEKGEVILCDSVDISVAVATDKVHGCITLPGVLLVESDLLSIHVLCFLFCRV